ncbi:MAG: hypothetical protein J6L60_02660 [Bacteroidaceae bacterium]|nr:hypothetical protein [Bacteroidaceae bacterium]
MPATEEIPFFSREKCPRLSRERFSAVKNANRWGLKRISEDRIAIGKRERGYSVLPLRKKTLLSGKNHEAFQKQHFSGQPICLVYILAILGGKVQDKA